MLNVSGGFYNLLSSGGFRGPLSRSRLNGVSTAGDAAVSHYIAEPCIGVKDTACVEVCPVDCIHPRKEEPDFQTAEQLYIDPNTCIDCGLCVDECPVKAIFPEDELPEKWRKYAAINAEYYEQK